jgi:hypothetical protein
MIRRGAVLALCASGLLALSACGSAKYPPAAAGTKTAPGTASGAPGSGSEESVRVGP